MNDNHRRKISRIANRAKNMIGKSIEKDESIKLMALLLIDAFIGLTLANKDTPSMELISKARSEVMPAGIDQQKWYHKAGAELGELALTLSFKVELNDITFTEGRRQINRKVRERFSGQRRERDMKPSVATSTNQGHARGIGRSEKPAYTRINPQQRRAA
ncbi:MAG: hypothetical protein WAR37_00590 [Candidatus Microsaccharimonas sp.]